MILATPASFILGALLRHNAIRPVIPEGNLEEGFRSSMAAISSAILGVEFNVSVITVPELVVFPFLLHALRPLLLFLHEEPPESLTFFLPVYKIKPVIPSSIMVLTGMPIFAHAYNPTAIPILSPLATDVPYLAAYKYWERSPIVLNIAGISFVLPIFFFCTRVSCVS